MQQAVVFKRMSVDCALLCGLVVALAGAQGGFDFEQTLPWALAFATLSALGAAAFGLYGGEWRWALTRGAGAAGFSALVFWMLPWQVASVEALAGQAVGGFAALLAARFARERGEVGVARWLVVGAGEEARAVGDALIGRAGLQVVGFYPLGDQTAALPARVLSAALPLDDTARALRVTDIVVAIGERRGAPLPQQSLLDCRARGVRVFDLSSFFERFEGQVKIDNLQPSWLIYGEGFRGGRARAIAKRSVDVVLGAMMLVAAAPLMALVAVAIQLDDPGPVFYRQERVGRNGRVFRVIKFRSMRIDAEADGQPRWAGANDARVTRVGRYLRRFRIDELPQLWNVLVGQMSLVGPRPERPFFVSRLESEVPFYALRHSIKPGLTGWAQVRYHYGDSLRDAVEKLQYDLYYLKHGGLLLDLRILLNTVRVVLTGQGAH